MGKVMCYYVSEQKLNNINIKCFPIWIDYNLLTKYTLFRIQCD